MSLKAEIGPELPYLRRYARALTGSQMLGDAAVREMLEALLVAPDEFDGSRPPRHARVGRRDDGLGLHRRSVRQRPTYVAARSTSLWSAPRTGIRSAERRA